MKIVTIVNDNRVTGVEYGEIEIAETVTTIKHANVSKSYNKMTQAKMKLFTNSRTKQK